MSESSLSVNPIVEPFAGGVIGLGLGYSMAPRKYPLKRLLIMNQKKLSEIYTEDVVHQMSPKEKKALDAILAARDEYVSARQQNRDEIKATARTWQQKFRSIEIPQSLQNNYEETKRILRESIQKENYITLKKQYSEAKKAAAVAPENTLLQDALMSANEALAKVRVRLAGKIENYRNTVTNIHNERLYEMKANPNKWLEVKEANQKFLTALARQRTILSNRLFELSNNKNLLKSYNTIKEYLPKARTKAALTGGLIMGCITALIVSRFNQNVINAA